MDAGPGSGWSHVAAKGATARKVEAQTPIGNKGGFAVLSLSSTRKKKEKEKIVEVADDWEAAEMMEEEKERASDLASGEASADEGAGQGNVSRPRSAVFALDGAQDDVNGLGDAASRADLGQVAAVDRIEADDIVVPTTPSKMRWADLDDEDE